MRSGSAVKPVRCNAKAQGPVRYVSRRSTTSITICTRPDSRAGGSGQPRGEFPAECGTQPDGAIQPEFRERLQAIGEWLAVNGDPIYGTTYGPIQGIDGIRTTAKRETVLVHVFDWKASGLQVAGLNRRVASAHLLATGQKLKFQQQPQAFSGARPSSSRPSSRKKSIVPPRSSTTIPTLSILFSAHASNLHNVACMQQRHFAASKYGRAEISKTPEQPLIGANHGRS